jgi:nicotinamide mononucleotide transporter
MEVIISQLVKTTIVEWVGTFAGLTGVYLSIKEKTLAWPFFILCYSVYTYLSFSASLYAAMILNACFIPVSCYGWWKWGLPSDRPSTEAEENQPLRISRMAPHVIVIILIISIGGTAVLGYLLSCYTEGAIPYLDAFATILSFLAQWMLSRKYIENWIAWLLADLAFILLWAIQGYWVTVVMFLVFTGMAIVGWISWRRELRNDGR